MVEASLDWEKGTQGNEQTIRLRNSSPFYDNSSNDPVIGAVVTVANNGTGAIYDFEDRNNGEYHTTGFEPEIGQSYSLTIIHNGETYSATETLNSVVEIDEIYQDREEGFDDEALEVHLRFTDPPEEGNNYLFKFHIRGELLPELEAAEDEFVNGNEIDYWFEPAEDEDEEENDEGGVQSGDIVDIEMYGISAAYYEYMEILINQLGGLGLFESTPVAVRGNCVNETNPDNYAHGYFRVTEVVRATYTFVDDGQEEN